MKSRYHKCSQQQRSLWLRSYDSLHRWWSQKLRICDLFRRTGAAAFAPATQPCLIVKDLKKGDSRGPIGLWIGSGTDAHFANLKVTAQE